MSNYVGLAMVMAVLLLIASLYLLYRIKTLRHRIKDGKSSRPRERFSKYLNNLDSHQITSILLLKKKKLHVFVPALLIGEPGIIITLVLIMLPLLAGIFIMILKLSNLLKQQRNDYKLQEAEDFAAYLKSEDGATFIEQLVARKTSLDYQLNNDELSGPAPAQDQRGMISNINLSAVIPFVAIKKKAMKRPNIDPALARLVIWYICSAAGWLLFGTTVGEYLGIKFVSPDIDHVSWLSFGRLRPVHTNAVFWGWSSLSMLGLGYYIVPMVSNTKLYSIRLGWYSLCCINAAVMLGSICLMAGINNGGGEYREYIWPVMLLFAVGLVFTLLNFLRTIARRMTKEIYISNWYIVSAIMFVLVITVVAYLPYWQHGLGETIVQGYYMHQGVGMWFMLFTLGIVYYFLPQQLNKPIYSYGLGILAFWSQIFFYTVIGTHHFVFSSIPWWLQTTAIVGSIGMLIPVGAGTTNFFMTFKGAWHKIGGSYTLPFFLTGIIFYFSGSFQGTAEAFRSTNLVWHFTDFTVAHSHITMYGIIAFFVWAAIYAVFPRLTGREAPQLTIGAHFWLALTGVLFYTVPLMYGSTLKGLLWMEGKPFTEGLVLMAPYWLWRAIGGSLMWLSHLVFAYNIYRMLTPEKSVDINEAAIEKLKRYYSTTGVSS
jgi:cytochrome c oxidase cbb3-type subunit 1